MNINEKEYFLKYFYLIDSEQLISSIVSTDIYKNYCNNPTEFCSEFFHTLFSKILNASSTYTSFVYSPDTFNYPSRNENIHILNGLSCLTRIVLRNHCIMHGFISSLQLSQEYQPIKISGKYDKKNRKGLFSAKLENNSNIKSYDTIHQIYTMNKKRFNKNPLNYSYKIMRRYSADCNNGFLVAPAFAANWFCFLYNESQVYTFDKNIANYTKTSSRYPLIKCYNELYERCLDWISSNQLCQEDILLFVQAMETFYGFSFFHSTAKLLNKIHSSSSDFASMTLKDLESETLLFNFQQAAQLPVTYNRHIFIEYAIHAVLSSRHLKDMVTPAKERSLFSAIPTEPSSKNQLTLSGLSLIENYLQRLKYIAIPLLQDLWEVVIYKLNNKYLTSSQLNIQLDTYRSYIHKNYHLLTNDYAGMSNEQLSKITEQALFEPNTDFGFVNSYCPCDYYKILATKYERESLEHLLKGYLIFERFDNASDGYSNNLFDSLQSDDISASIKYQFHKNHKENITSLCKWLPPLCTYP